MIFKDYKPLIFFLICSMFLAILSILSGLVPIIEFYNTGLVTTFPRAILAAGIGIIATLSFTVGLILDTISKYHNENFLLLRRYLKKQ